jgi:hypothetical protein
MRRHPLQGRRPWCVHSTHSIASHLVYVLEQSSLPTFCSGHQDNAALLVR